jgi:hypothetical protein
MAREYYRTGFKTGFKVQEISPFSGLILMFSIP